jgi:proline dehydrogenase
VEIDMEGTQMVDFTLNSALLMKQKGYPVILALQSYQNRTGSDIKICRENEITVRLIKGAYKGDMKDFRSIQDRFKELYEELKDGPVLVGTHDPDILNWIKKRADRVKLEFGFLKGLADKTKLQLSREGWLVSEYLPFGIDAEMYESRRKRYLKELETLKRTPAP